MRVRIFIVLTIILVFTGCSNDDHSSYEIGGHEWNLEIPKNFVHHIDQLDTIPFNSLCGSREEGQMIQLFEVQENDTVWVDPIPNAITAFICDTSMFNSVSLSDCIDELLEMYAYHLGIQSIPFDYKSEEIKLGEFKLTKFDHTIKNHGKYGDVHYIGLINSEILHVQFSYNSLEGRKRLAKIIESSTID